MALHPRLDDLLELRHQARTLGLASHHLVNSSFSGLYASVFRGTGLDFEEVREYHEGDDIRNMEWKVTARTNSPHLKTFREERERSVVLCVDQGPHMSFGTRGTFKSIQAARTAALLGWAANSLNDRVGGLLFGDNASTAHHFRPTKDRRALWRLLRALSRPSEGAEAVKDPLLNALQRAERGTATGSLIFIIADLNREVTSLETTIGRLSQRHSLVLIPIDDKADHDLPDVGRALFTDHAGDLLEIETGDDAGRTAYRKSWEQNRQFLAGIANRLRIPLIPVATDDEVHQALMRGMRHTRRLQ
ncbi:MAG: DUF58 domain-containing protein [Chromatiaceae bacterium]|nr:DUF58 domain-containing protein [Gammaproteobacteria bacterium]MCB1880301.1 DUF58 domain-containing protein [Gammaproteobacteria bacterium]MCP5427349.1 DUF58 domain-containing protein [Chromatiaceae bacterium]MCP5447814.1 DUF58 domain-containing protein [Chromatiaceae bacterium]